MLSVCLSVCDVGGSGSYRLEIRQTDRWHAVCMRSALQCIARCKVFSCKQKSSCLVLVTPMVSWVRRSSTLPRRLAYSWPTPRASNPNYFIAAKLGLWPKLIGKDWTPFICGAGDTCYTSVGTTSFIVRKRRLGTGIFGHVARLSDWPTTNVCLHTEYNISINKYSLLVKMVYYIHNLVQWVYVFDIGYFWQKVNKIYNI